MFFFYADGERSKKNRIHDFSGFDFKTDCTQFEVKMEQTLTEFSLNDFVTLCNLLCTISNEEFVVALEIRISIYLSDLTLLQTFIQNESETEYESKFISNNAGNARNEISLPSN